MTSSPVKATRWTTNSYGNIDNLCKESFEIPHPTEGQVIVTVRAIGLNFADVFGVLGLYTPAGDPPYTPGFEFCGTVHSTSSDVHDFKVGDKVYGMTKFGGFTTAISVHQDYLFQLPEEWSFEQGAAFACQALTAWYALCILGGLEKGASRMLTSPAKRVIVHSAAGGVGLMLVEIIRHIGGEIIATVGNPKKVQILQERDVPAEQIIVRGKDDADGFENAVRRRIGEGEGVDVIIDSVMGAYFDPGWKLLNPGGRYIVMGSGSLMPSTSLNIWNMGSLLRLAWGYLQRPKLDPINMIGENKSVAGFNLIYLFDRIDFLERGMKELSDMNLPPPLVSRTFAFDDAKEALREFQKGNSIGKLVLVCSQEG